MVIGIVSLKGGSGKSTVSTNLAVCFAHMGHKVCIVDSDTNQSCVKWYSRRSDEPQIDVVGGADAKAIGGIVQAMHKNYDIVIIDGTPTLSEMTTRVILASDFVLMPTYASVFDLDTAAPIIDRLLDARVFKPNLPAYFVVNQFAKSTILQKGMREKLQDFGVETLISTLARRNAYQIAATFGQGVIEGTDTKAINEFTELMNEIISKCKLNNLIQ